jgi:hypothetical protein
VKGANLAAQTLSPERDARNIHLLRRFSFFLGFLQEDTNKGKVM